MAAWSTAPAPANAPNPTSTQEPMLIAERGRTMRSMFRNRSERPRSAIRSTVPPSKLPTER